MAIKTRATIKEELAALLVDTAPAESLQPSLILAKLNDICDSFLNTPTDTNLQGLYPYDATLIYYVGAIVQYDYSWYKANTTTVAGAFDLSKWDFQGYVLYSGSLNIVTADVLTLNGTPKTLVSAIASRTLRLRNIRASIIFNSIAYATNTTLNIYMPVGGASNIQFTVPAMLAATADQYRMGTITSGAQTAINAALMVAVATGNPTAGDSPITIYFDYTVER